MSGAPSISTRRAYGVQRICRVWERARSSVWYDATSSGWTRQRRSEYRQTTVQEPWGDTLGRFHERPMARAG